MLTAEAEFDKTLSLTTERKQLFPAMAPVRDVA